MFSLILVLLLFFILGQYQFLRSANYYEQLIESRRTLFENADDIGALVPRECKYLLFNKEGMVLRGNVEKDKASDVWDAVQKESNEAAGRFLKVFYRENEEICVVLYKITLGYSYPIMEEFYLWR